MPRNGLLTASVFELVQPLAEPTTDRAVMRAYRVNPLSIFPARAYEEDRVVRPFFGRPSILTSRAEDIRHVLLDNADNYRRSRAGIRILRPLLGDGLFMASGAAWRAQRRTIAPAFIPSAVPTFAKAAAEALIPARRDLLEHNAGPNSANRRPRARHGLEKTAVRGPEPLPPLSRGLEQQVKLVARPRNQR